ncbi:hypothetical protein BGZ99_007593 [Dissophora globulifera]|uniref:Uncharacterized protein n=1 Tax=Dissophora globulifera TaxID=979702 RepID=A0A9P6RAD4_9FUNG|nr:hypothetical protein BGZ99_007593 [Dissophora globulifera]
MSRPDISSILRRLDLGHRASLEEKASSFLNVVESKGIRNHPSHAAVCVDIAASQLSIEVSREQLLRLSTSNAEGYNSTLQQIRRLLKEGPSLSASPPILHHYPGEPRHDQLRQLLTSTPQVYLRQLAVKYGSMELDSLVLDCLQRFFDIWFKTLPPAQRVHVKYSDPKWVGAAFWLCAMARNTTVTKDATETANAAKAKAVKRIGGRGGKELKDIVLTGLQHSVKRAELDNTIRLIEDTAQDYLMSLRKTKGNGPALAIGSTSAGLATSSRRRSTLTTDDNGSGSQKLTSSARPGQQGRSMRPRSHEREDSDAQPPQVHGSGALSSRSRGSGRSVDAYRSLGTKRQLSNVSQMSLVSDADEAEQDKAKPPSKRKKLASQEMSASLVDNKSPNKSDTQKGLQETATAPLDSARLLNARRKTGGVYSMIPRVKYQNTKAYAQYQEWRSRMLGTLASEHN